jgi:hypothetical protein
MDIVEKLRGAHWADKIAHEAADEIERLRETLKIFADNVKQTNMGIDENWAKTVYPLKAENKRLRDMLKKLTGFEFYFDGSNSDDLMKLMDEARQTLGEKE